MSAFAERISQDLRKLDELSKSTGGRIKVKSRSGNPVNRIVVDIEYPTAPSQEYPKKIQKITEVRIDLLSRYPFQEPSATITTPIYHPNVYGSGKICFGKKWLPTQGLDLLIKRVVQIVTFDSTVLNEESPANGLALRWYRETIKKFPEAFPTDRLIVKEDPKKGMSWNNVDAEISQKAIIKCPKCRGSMKVPVGRKLNVNCPACSHQFLVTT
jgi:ubiquitin-protein ligase